jgi:hypothetical protein
LSAAGMIIVNPTKFSVNQFSEGNYIVLSDNTDINPSTGYQKVKGIKAVDSSKEYTPVLPGRLNFGLNQTNTAIKSSLTISEVLEGLPSGINFEDQSYVDSLVVSHFKLKSSTYAQDTLLLDYKLMGSYVGSLYKKRSQNNPAGGLPMSFSLENTLNSKTADLKVIINPYISESTGWVDSNGKVLKKVRLAVYDPTDSTTSVEDETRNLYSVGNFKDDSTLRSNDVGNIPKKLSRVLEKIDILDLDIDIMAEAGLGTIWAHACEHPLSTPPADKRFAGLFSSPDGYPDDDGTYFFDDSTPISQTKLDELKRQDLSQTLSDCDLRDNYLKIAEQFRNFAQNVRKDHLFLADPLRCVFVNGKDLRAIKNPDYNFSRDIYWSLKNLFGSLVSSYAATYGNWIKWNDIYQDKEVWLPASGYVAADIADSTAKNFPWSAPAGFNRGLLTNVLDVAVNPTLKQRDQLYKININPIAYFQGDGYVIFGQKTLYNKPSAFDRINVRRLFLHLEKVSKQLLKYYLFEPNTYSTRSRLVAALTPEFAKAKNNDGVYDYKIVCDERNNTPDVIDNNELKLSIYIQPVRTAEFILADFIATRTGVNFDELTA